VGGGGGGGERERERERDKAEEIERELAVRHYNPVQWYKHNPSNA
jgi:hypothetical protein